LGLRSEFEKKISELEMTLEVEVRAELGSKDGIIGKLESQVMDYHRQVDSLQEIAHSKAQWAKELQSAIEQKDSKMADLENFTGSQTAQLESLKKDFENQSEHFRQGQLLVSA
jgi:chromosome segregation ATPase